MTEWLNSPLQQHALFALLLTSVACGIVGTYIVVRRMLFLSGAISHASYGGVGLSWYLGISVISGALIFTPALALIIGFISRRARQSEDVAITMMWVTGMALGTVFIALADAYPPDPFSFLFGNPLFVSTSDLMLMGGLLAGILFVVVLLYKEFLALSFDEDFGRVLGIPVERLYYVLLGLMAITVVIAVKVVGVIVLIVLLAAPPAIARHYTHTLWKMMLLASVVGALLNTFGLWLSYYAFPDIPPVAIIALVNVGAWVLSLALSSLRSRYKTNTQQIQTAAP
jgi:zinc transport system permease protein